MRGSLVRLGLLGSLGLALLLPRASFADSTEPASAPHAPASVAATLGCSDVAGFCHLLVSWSAWSGGGSPATSFTVTGNVTNEPTIVNVSGNAAGDEPDTYSVGWPASAPRGNPADTSASTPTRYSDTSYSVTANNAFGTSAPATAIVETTGGYPPPRHIRPSLDVAAWNNGPHNDVLVFHADDANGRRFVVRINRRKHVLVLRRGFAKITVKDRNGAKPTIYAVKAGWTPPVTVR